MSATDTLKHVAKMLPEDRRERFLLMCARFQSVPEDDEYLLILESIGLMTLLMNALPQQIKEILERAAPAGSNNQQIEALVKRAVSGSIPSYDDLKRATERLENHETALKRLLNNQGNTSKKDIFKDKRWLWFVAGFLTNFLVGYGLYLLF